MPSEKRSVPGDASLLRTAPDPLDPGSWSEGGDVGAPADVHAAGSVCGGPVRLVILGEPVSKANSRKLVMIGGKLVPIKSSKALAYERDALRQIPGQARRRIEGPVRVTLILRYASERPDLDESLLLDVLQDRYVGSGEQRELVQAGVYRNDRQVRERHVYHRIDRSNPRAEITVEPLLPQHADGNSSHDD